ncbi:MAG TPA: DNA replication/repair protein RecF [Gammaproteobacteria bacterium]|nr:DNA replication/repair protein RecF [Gammaproteobacteria bacterium]
MSDGKLTRIVIQNIRNVEQAELQPATGLNLITGINAAGKTSLLEAIFFLSRARSFRTHHLKRVIQSGSDKLAIYARIQDNNSQWPLGLEKSTSKQVIRIRNKTVTSVAELTRTLPVQLIQPGCQRLLEDGPAARRHYLDWGVFHVEHDFHNCWRRYYRALKQRNAALRAKQVDIACVLEPELVVWGEKLHNLRKNYVVQLTTQLQDFMSALFPDLDIAIHYRSGWLEKQGLQLSLQDKLARDLERGSTSSGPHRANLEFMIDGTPAESYLSRGQLKMFVICLILAQMKHFQTRQNKSCILLIDDITAELDQRHQQLLIDWASQIDCQTFITAIEAEPLLLRAVQKNGGKRFHVERGHVKEVVQ